MKFWYCLLLISSSIISAWGQGCSDAGFCTVSSLLPSDTATAILKNQLKAGIAIGKADYSISIFSQYVEFNRELTKRLGLDVKLTSILQRGNKIQSFGASDLFVTTAYKFSQHLSGTVGAKIPLSNGNKSNNNLPLPMDYQSSLGTYDIIAGLSYSTGNFLLAVGYQQPLTQNDNAFISSDYPETSPLSKFQSTNNFKRSGDVLLRVMYNVKVNENFSISPGLLPIYHLKNDRYTNESNEELVIKNSAGLTLNTNLFVDYTLNDRHALHFNASIPLVVRKERPDGLTRSFIATIEYRIKF